jgi:dihydrofolate reductase
MRKLIYSMGMSLDGVIAGPDGEIDWSAPDAELHRFHNEQTRELGAHLCGRRLYEEMLYWETAEENPSVAEHEREFARIWKRLPKIVVSTTRGGTPLFPALERRIDLELVETRTFGSRVVYLRYR